MSQETIALFRFMETLPKDGSVQFGTANFARLVELLSAAEAQPRRMTPQQGQYWKNRLTRSGAVVITEIPNHHAQRPAH